MRPLPSGDWKKALTVRRGYEFNYQLRAFQVEAHEGNLAPQHSFVSVAEDNVVLTAVKKAEDSDALLLRCYEWAGKTGTVNIQLPEGVSGASLTNLMEKPTGDQLPVANHQVTVPVHPFEIVSVLLLVAMVGVVLLSKKDLK